MTIRSRDMALFVDHGCYSDIMRPHIVNIQHIFVSSLSISKVILIIRSLSCFQLFSVPSKYWSLWISETFDWVPWWSPDFFGLSSLWFFFTMCFQFMNFLHNVFSNYDFSSQCVFKWWIIIDDDQKSGKTQNKDCAPLFNCLSSVWHVLDTR